MSSLFRIYGVKKFYIENKYVFSHIFLFTVTSKSSIDINTISIFNNQQCMNTKT